MGVGSSQRLHGLDFLRVSLLILGVFYHVSLVFKVDSDWRVFSDNSSVLFNYFSDLTSLFRMSTFFVISGFFFSIVSLRKKNNEWFYERVKFLLVPIISVAFSFNILMVLSYSDFNHIFTVEYFRSTEWLAHLWFLSNLIIYNFIFHYIFKHRVFEVSRFIDRFNFIFILIAVALFSFVLRGMVFSLGLNDFFVIKTAEFFKYIPCYFLGVYLGCSGVNASKRLPNLLLAIASLIFFVVKFYFPSELVSKIFEYFFSAFFSYLLFSIAFSLKAVFASPSFIRFGFFLYLVHQPFIVISYIISEKFLFIQSPYFAFIVISFFTLLLSFSLFKLFSFSSLARFVFSIK